MGGGGDREGEGLSANNNSNGTTMAGSLQQPAVPPTTQPVVVANGGGGSVEKVKFTVSVRGHQWSSARHVNETLQEFASAIQVLAISMLSLLRTPIMMSMFPMSLLHPLIGSGMGSVLLRDIVARIVGRVFWFWG
jgi:hypothetical protein